MADLERTVRIELFNNARFMSLVAESASGLSYRDALIVASDLIIDRLDTDYHNTRFSGPVLQALCWNAIGSIDSVQLARECLDILGVR